MNVHNNKIASVIQRAVQSLLTRGLNDPRVRGLISVTGVELNAEGTQATIGVSILPEKNVDLTMHGLKHAAQHIRYQVARDIRLRRLPVFVFKLDKSIKKESEVLAAIATARRRSGENVDEVVDETQSSHPRSEVPES